MTKFTAEPYTSVSPRVEVDKRKPDVQTPSA